MKAGSRSITIYFGTLKRAIHSINKVEAAISPVSFGNIETSAH